MLLPFLQRNFIAFHIFVVYILWISYFVYLAHRLLISSSISIKDFRVFVGDFFFFFFFSVHRAFYDYYWCCAKCIEFWNQSNRIENHGIVTDKTVLWCIIYLNVYCLRIDEKPIKRIKWMKQWNRTKPIKTDEMNQPSNQSIRPITGRRWW